MGSECSAESAAGRKMMACSAIVLAAGSGKRMGTSVKKQYLDVGGMPVLAYSLRCFDRQPFIKEIILVTSPEEMLYCRKEIVETYGIQKVRTIVPGGAERCDSVYEGLKACQETSFVFIHDGARPFVSDSLLEKLYDDVQEYEACIAAVRAKDTIKIADAEGNIVSTPDRRTLWQAQTPQVFDRKLILSCYTKAIQENACNLTDDASCVEYCGEKQVHLTEGSYDNIKITTPEDLKLAKELAEKYR